MTPIDQDLQPRQISIDSIFTRRQIRVSKIIVHENFTDSITDLAILKLGKKNLSGDPFYKKTNARDFQFTEERVDLSVVSPACLPDIGESFLGQDGHVYGEH